MKHATFYSTWGSADAKAIHNIINARANGTVQVIIDDRYQDGTPRCIKYMAINYKGIRDLDLLVAMSFLPPR